MVWKPHVTVAAVVQRDGKFLLVEEETEAGLAFKPTHLVGIYNWTHPTKEDATYLRFAFAGELRG